MGRFLSHGFCCVLFSAAGDSGENRIMGGGNSTINSKKTMTALCAAFAILMSQTVYAQDAGGGEASSAQPQASEESLLTDNDDATPFGLSWEEESPAATSSTSTLWLFVRMFLMLTIVLGIIWLVFRLLKSGMMPGQETDTFLRKVASLPLSPGKAVHVVTLVDKAYVIGVAENSVNLIAEVGDKELVEALNLHAERQGSVPRPKNFSEVLDLFTAQHSRQKQGVPPRNTGSVFDGSDTSRILDSIKKQADRLDGE